MTDFRWVTPDFAVASQISPADLAVINGLGFRTVINNRPDGEVPNQPTGAEIAAATSAAGLTYRAVPFAGPPPPAVVAELCTLLAEAEAPILAYCRSGSRSILAWALAQALSGARDPDAIIALTLKAGYQHVAKARDALQALAPRR